MLRFAPVLLLLVACGGPEIEAATVVAAPAEIEMAAVEMMIPASHAEMLKEEVAALRAETERLTLELKEAKTPTARKVAKRTRAMYQLAEAESELNRLRQELTETQDKLVVAEKKNVVLQAELVETEAELAETTQDLDRSDRALRRTRSDLDGARRVAADAGWSDLVSKTQVALCPKGGRKKMHACRQDATAAINPFEAAARECLRSGQAVPQLERAARGEIMPRQAVWVGEAGDDYFVVLCDPTLPEARELIASRGARTKVVVEERKRVEAPERTVAKASYDRPEREARQPRERVSDAPDSEPDEPMDLLSDNDDDGLDIALLGLQDLDAEDDSKSSRDQRRKAKKEEEEMQNAGSRRAVLDDVGDDLLDE